MQNCWQYKTGAKFQYEPLDVHAAQTVRKIKVTRDPKNPKKMLSTKYLVVGRNKFEILESEKDNFYVLKNSDGYVFPVPIENFNFLYSKTQPNENYPSDPTALSKWCAHYGIDSVSEFLQKNKKKDTAHKKTHSSKNSKKN